MSSYAFPDDIACFVAQQLASGHYQTEDDVLRDALNLLRQVTSTPAETRDEYQQTVAAVQQGLADFQAGRVQSLRDLIGKTNSGAGPERS